MTMLEEWNKHNADDMTIRYLDYLFCRWSDECEHEDWKDYDKAIKAKFENVIKTGSRPVSMTIRCDDGDIKINLVRKGSRCWLRAESK